MVVGWQVSTNSRSDLALEALDMGLWSRHRNGQRVTDLKHHSDRGVQYQAIRYTERLTKAEAVASVSSEGNSYDNAMAEAFNRHFKAECIRNPAVRTRGGWRNVATSRSPLPNTSTGSAAVDNASTANSAMSHQP